MSEENPIIGRKMPEEFDKIEESAENVEGIYPLLNLAESVAKFKAKCIKAMEWKRWKTVKITLHDLAKYFHFQPGRLGWQWFPQRIRDECKTQGIHFQKQRGQDWVEITIDGVRKDGH